MSEESLHRIECGGGGEENERINWEEESFFLPGKKKNRFLLQQQKDDMGRKAPTPTLPGENLDESTNESNDQG